MSFDNSGHSVDVLVVGAGQAGLATGHLLARTGLSFRLQERHRRIGDSWRERYDSLVLFSSRACDGLPGLAFPGDSEGYPTKNEVADYLEQYAETSRLPVATGDGVVRLERRGERFAALTDKGFCIAAKAVIVAAGGFQEPIVPEFARRLATEVVQLNPKTYRNPTEIRPGRVLVVGSGATGRQVSAELAATRQTRLSCGGWIPLSPQRLLGRDTIWWFDKIGALRADKDSLYGRLVRRFDATPGLNLSLPALRKRGVRTVARAQNADGRRVFFADGRSEQVDTVIWAMGYRDDCSWIRDPEALDSDGQCLEERGISPVSGLFFVGRSWQNSRGSALLCGVARDAAEIVAAATRYISAHART